MNKSLVDVSAFEYKKSCFNAEFENILIGIIACYYCITATKTRIPPNNENLIRDIMLFQYLKIKKFKDEHPPLYRYQFDKETIENSGRADIRILNVNPYIDDYSYYIIECKRLDNDNPKGKTGLNGEYISDGIARFVTENKYPFYNHTAGMIGFVVSKMDIHRNVGFINQLLQNTFTDINTERELTHKQITTDFDYSYFSQHKVDNSTRTIYHLMFDFTNNINETEY
jgi:hypothetical protein